MYVYFLPLTVSNTFLIVDFFFIYTFSMYNLSMYFNCTMYLLFPDILHGSVGVLNNYNLCHIKTIQWQEIITGPTSRYVFVYNFTEPERDCTPCHESCKVKTSAPIKAWNFNFPPLKEIVTNRRTNWQTVQPSNRRQANQQTVQREATLLMTMWIYTTW